MGKNFEIEDLQKDDILITPTGYRIQVVSVGYDSVKVRRNHVDYLLYATELTHYERFETA